MSIKDTSKQDMRAMLLKNGNVPPTSIVGNTVKHMNRKDSMESAIAARRAEFASSTSNKKVG